ncbi:hypothetical protein DKM44_14695 [Deinococcus irradiatisoli]|uniref:Lipoprotein n=1 Tax=Deinococcus irradiatisoli TaxID=2202254 RepID=A0A2Z3JIF1_9DEIO|nr:hypothetical protein [Deinococcus irradiatisoli]AWN24715.1 hypothetical protein DKM44_14695 [Deinococcus irradiatisoli]
MKRWAWTLLIAPLLWACGAAVGPVPAAVPKLSAGELLKAPVKLAVGGVKFSAEARPYLSALSACSERSCAPNFVVPVELRASGEVGALKVTGVYVITEGGVWRSGVATQDSRRCWQGSNCLQVVGRGNADLTPNDAVQVVLTLRDAAGRTYKLRDDKAVVSKP